MTEPTRKSNIFCKSTKAIKKKKRRRKITHKWLRCTKSASFGKARQYKKKPRIKKYITTHKKGDCESLKTDCNSYCSVYTKILK